MHIIGMRIIYLFKILSSNRHSYNNNYLHLG